MHKEPDGSIRYEFPTEPHPPLPHNDTSNRGKYGLKPKAQAAQDSA